MSSIILSESGFGDHIGVRANQENFKRNQPRVSSKEGMGRLILWTCAHHYFVLVGATDPKPKNQETQMTPKGVPMYCLQEL